MADISDRLDRLQRREEFDRFGRPIRAVPEPVVPVLPVVSRPAGVDDRLGEVLDAVAAVVGRHPGLSVMVAVADGRAGRPVVRVTERDGGVETGVVVPATPAGRVAVAAAPEEQATAVPSASAPVRADFTPAREPALAAAGREPGYAPVREVASAARELPVREAPYGGRDAEVREAVGFGREAGREPREAVGFSEAGREIREAVGFSEAGREIREAVGFSEAGRGTREAVAFGREAGRETRDATIAGPARDSAYAHPLARETGRPIPAGDPVFEAPGRDSAPRVPAYRPPARETAVPAGDPVFEQGRHAAPHDDAPGFSGNSWHNSLWSKDRGRPEPEPEPAGVPVAEDTSQVVSRLAQLLRENPTLASSWSRESE